VLLNVDGNVIFCLLDRYGKFYVSAEQSVLEYSSMKLFKLSLIWPMGDSGQKMTRQIDQRSYLCYTGDEACDQL